MSRTKRIVQSGQPLARSSAETAKRAFRATKAKLLELVQREQRTPRERDTARDSEREAWERSAEKDRAYQVALDERDAARAESFNARWEPGTLRAELGARLNIALTALGDIQATASMAVAVARGEAERPAG